MFTSTSGIRKKPRTEGVDLEKFLIALYNPTEPETARIIKKGMSGKRWRAVTRKRTIVGI